MKTNFELLTSVKNSFELKNLSLKRILEIKAPLLDEKSNELRLYYSQYFTSLISTTELLLDKNENNNYKTFDEKLKKKFIFDNFLNGKNNYEYIKNIRNSILHRGLNITSSAHFENDFPWIIAPEKVQDKWNQNTYSVFEFYLMNIIKKCELYIPNIIFDYFQELDILKIEENQEQLLQEYLKELDNISDSTMLTWVREMAKKSMPNIDYIGIRKDSINRYLDELKVDLLDIKKR